MPGTPDVSSPTEAERQQRERAMATAIKGIARLDSRFAHEITELARDTESPRLLYRSSRVFLACTSSGILTRSV
jgi:hypothetical protein